MGKKRLKYPSALALLALGQTLAVQAGPPPQDFDLTPVLARKVGLNLMSYAGITTKHLGKMNQTQCTTALRGFRAVAVGSIFGVPVTMETLATLHWYNGGLQHVSKPEALRHAEPATRGVLRQTRDVLDRARVNPALDPLAYRDAQENVSRLRMAFENEARVRPSQELQAQVAAFKDLERVLADAKFARQVNYWGQWPGKEGPKIQEGPKIDVALRTVENMMKLPQAPAATLTAATEGAQPGASAASKNVSNLDLVTANAGSPARGATGGGAIVPELPKAGEITVPSAGAPRLGVGGWFMIASLFGVGLDALLTRERVASIHNEHGAKISAEWKRYYPEANDINVFAGDATEICQRAIHDPKGFGKVVSQKIMVVERWGNNLKSMQSQELLEASEILATGETSSVTNKHDKLLGDSTDPVRVAGAVSSETGVPL